MKWVRLLALLVLAAVAAGAVIIWLTRAESIDAASLAPHPPDLANGERLYHAGGCLACHAGAEGENAKLPAGGKPLKTPAGNFYPPNITPDTATGIGAWSDADFITAMARGSSPDGRHYFPAFPYTSYRNMTLADLRDLKAYLFSLKAVARENRPHDVPLASLARLAMGVWKLLADGPRMVPAAAAKGGAWNRGAYLVQGPGHCGECHTPRNLFMVMDGSRFLAGGPHPEGKGKVPNLRRLIARGRFKDMDDLATALKFGEAFGYEDMSSGGMGDVQENLAKLPDADLKAIATFLASLN